MIEILQRASRRRSQPPLAGPVRSSRRTKDLVKRLSAGDIAVIDHEDIDRISAEELIAVRPAAVWNVSPSSSGRYPNQGPSLLLDAQIPLFQNTEGDPFTIHDGSHGQLRDDQLWIDGRPVATGHRLTHQDVEEQVARGRERVGTALSEFAANTVEFIDRESELVYGGIDVPPLQTIFRERHALVVARGYHYREDLRALRAYIRETRPVLVGVDGGADALIDLGHRPDVICGDMDSITDPALRCGAELVVHAYTDGRAPGAARLDELRLEHHVFSIASTSEDAALLLAYERGASLIVAVGTHFNLTEFLDKSRKGMASTFLTRLRIGERLIDAKGVNSLYTPKVGTRWIVALIAGVTACVGAVVAASPALANTVELLLLTLRSAL